MRSAACALATSSRCSESVSAVISALSSLTSSRAFASAPARCCRSAATLVAGPRRDRDRGAEPLCDQAAGFRHRRRDGRGVHTRLTSAFGAQPCFALGGSRPTQRIRLSTNGVRALFGGAHGQAGLHLGGAGDLGRRHRLLPIDGFGFEPRLLLGVVQPLLEFGELLNRLVATGLQLVALLDEPLPLVVGRTRVLAEASELLVNRRDGRVGLVERREGLFGGVLSGGLFRQRTGQRGRQFGCLPLGRRQLLAGLLDLGRDLQRAGLAVGTAGDPARADKVAVGGDRLQLRARRDHVQRGGEVTHHRDARQHGGDRALQPVGRVNQIQCPQRPLGQRAGVRCGVDRPVAQDDGSTAAVGLLQRGDGRARRA